MQNFISQKLRDLDAYPKINEDFYNRTFSGGVVTVVSAVIMFFLFLFELNSYLLTVTETTLVVDTSRGGTLRINFDVTFPEITCTVLSIDAEDISGERHFDIRHDIVKTRVDALGNVIDTRRDGIGAPKIEKPLQKHGGRLEHNETYCGSCYGAETGETACYATVYPGGNIFPTFDYSSIASCNLCDSDPHHEIQGECESDDQCCNSCEEVREAYSKNGWALTNMDLIDQCEREGFFQKIHEEKGEGCNINGFLEVNKVAGTFHFIPGKTFHLSEFHASDLFAIQTDNYNISHRINKLAFGDYFPGVVNPLNGVQFLQETASGSYQYFLKVVPTIYTDARQHTIMSNQFSVTEHFKNAEPGRFRTIPGVFFYYDLSPVKVNFTEKHMSFLHFMTNVCAIVGGTFTVAGMVDSFVYYGRKAMKKKL